MSEEEKLVLQSNEITTDILRIMNNKKFVCVGDAFARSLALIIKNSIAHGNLEIGQEKDFIEAVAKSANLYLGVVENKGNIH